MSIFIQYVYISLPDQVWDSSTHTNKPYIYKIQPNVAFEVAQLTAMFLTCIHIQTWSLNN